jgi:diguanylate cyclase
MPHSESNITSVFAGSAADPAANNNAPSLMGMTDEQLQRVAQELAENPDVIFEFLKRQRSELSTLRDQSLTDPLTGIPNRAAFDKALDRTIRIVKRQKKEDVENPDKYVVIYFDLNKFKPINDELGHAAGDAAIIAFAQKLQSTVRANEDCARLGGDEFAVIINDTSHNPKFRSQARQRFKEALIPFHFKFDGKFYPLTACYGTLEIKSGMTSDEIMHAVDKNMQHMKKRLGESRGGPCPSPVEIYPEPGIGPV